VNVVLRANHKGELGVEDTPLVDFGLMQLVAYREHGLQTERASLGTPITEI
jgi:hypothetical protein